MTDVTTAVSGGPLRDHVYRQLLSFLVSGEYGPGDHLPERLIGERLGVSRGPVREAIRLLERDGWVQLRSGRGSFVTALSDTEVEEIYEARMVVEAASARLAAIRAPAAGYPQLVGVVEQAMHLLEEPDRREESHEELSTLTMRFHHEVSELSGNGFLIEFSQRIQTMSHRIVAQLTPRIAPDAWTEHDLITRAINSGNAALAEDLMRRHLDWSRRVYRGADVASATARRRGHGIHRRRL